MASASNPGQAAEPSRRARGFLLQVLPAIGWLAAIFIGGGADMGPPEVDVGLPFDKVQHVVAFGVLGYLLFRALRHVLPGSGKQRQIALSAFLSVSMGILLELYQLGLPHRSADIADVVADAVGAGAAALWLLWRP